jgi:hypothetical protein
VGAVILLAVVALGSGSDPSESNVVPVTTPGPIPRQDVPKQVAETPRELPSRISIPALPDIKIPRVPNTLQPTAGGPRLRAISAANASQVRFVAENWVRFAQTRNLGAFCIFMTDRFRGRLTGASGVQSLSNCVSGSFRKFTLGKRLLPLRSIRGRGSRALVTFGGGQVATLVRHSNGAYKVDAFRR